MRKILNTIINALVWPFALLYPAKLALRVNLICNQFYAAYLKHKFKKASTITVHQSPVLVRGGQYIELGEDVTFNFYARIEAVDRYATGQRFTPQLILGDHVIVQALCHIGCINKVVVGKHTSLGQRTYVTDHIHGEVTLENLNKPHTERNLYSKGPVIIGEYVQVGENCSIMPGVTIGDHCVIGANSVVTRDIPPYSIAAGVPAKVLKTFDPAEATQA